VAGRISDGDIERVRDANRIDQVVAEYVALRPAGGGNLKGLCPFHDEKTPSFQVSPGRGGGRYHCFGCGQGGDVFEFVREMEHLTFLEAVQRLAERVGITLTVVEGGTTQRTDRGSKPRLLAANKAAAEFYAAQLATEEAAPARAYLTERGFDQAAAAHFGCGYAPGGWDKLTKALTGQGFSLEELGEAGLSRPGQRGWIDQFQRRLLWSIRDPSGNVVGFGARRIFDDDRIEAKYVNTSEKPLYRKSQLLFGLDLAKRDIARERTVVVVEGYTDVMAMHLAGVTNAVASCGTAFGDEHITVLRRYLQDSDEAKVIYTFDGDAAGQKAALKAFESDQRFAASTYISVAPDGMDPCELRQAHGDQAVRDLVAARRPLFEFAMEHTLGRFDLNTVEGRVAAAGAAVPVVAGIRDQNVRDGYARRLAGLVGLDERDIRDRVRRAAGQPQKTAAPQRSSRPAGPTPTAPAGDGWRRPNPNDHQLFGEREALKLVLQHPVLLAAGWAQAEESWFTDLGYARVFRAIDDAGGPAPDSGYLDRVSERVPAGAVRSLVSELVVEPVRTSGDPDPRYAGAILASLAAREAGRREEELRSDLRRAEARGDAAAVAELSIELKEVSEYRRALQDRANGS
jgi:DNA primase